MKLMSWNVNGIRAVYKKGFVEFIEREQPDVLCVQETKAHVEQCEPLLRRPDGMESYWSSGIRKGYSGVATFTRKPAHEVAKGIGIERFDQEGRFVITKHDGFTLYNIYFPNGGSGLERHQFKQEFLADLKSHLKPKVEQGEAIIVTGDYNVAHREIDIYDPVRLAGESGFLPEERLWFDVFLGIGFVDTFRYLHPKQTDTYTWWSMRERARLGNRGWRIDYFCVTENLVSKIVRADILDEQQGSDHCPVVLELKD